MAIVHLFDDEAANELAAHLKHKISIANYAEGESVCVECEKCGEILIEIQPTACQEEAN